MTAVIKSKINQFLFSFYNAFARQAVAQPI
jgi:hypothetical protein